MAVILITGGSGLIGQRLTQALQQRGAEVRWLSRKPGPVDGVRVFAWDVAKGTMDHQALRDVDLIVHLAGAGIADRRWSNSRIAELIGSRTDSARLLLRTVREVGCKPKGIVSASGIGYYGAVTRAEPFTEDDQPGHDAIARITVEWERAVDEWASVCRVVKLRTPVVLAREGGALPKLAAPARWGLGAALGTGRQCMPWIHIDDLIAAYLHAMEDDTVHGAYNLVGGNASNSEFTRALAKALGRPHVLPHVPAFALRLALGAMADVLLEGSPVSAAKAKAAGIAPQHTHLAEALRSLL